MILNERLEPGEHWDKDAKLDPLWLVGIILPQSFDNKESDTFEKISVILERENAQILTLAKENLEPIVEIVLEEAFPAKDSNIVEETFSVAAVPVVRPDPMTMTLIQCLRREQTVQKLDAQLRISLDAIKGMKDMPACTDLRKTLDPSVPPKSKSTLALQWFEEVLTCLQNLYPKGMFPPGLEPVLLSPISSNDVETATIAAYETGDSVEPEADDDLDLIDAAAQTSELDSSFEAVKLWMRLAQHVKLQFSVPKRYKCFMNPTTGALKVSFFKSNEVLWHPASQPITAEVQPTNDLSGSKILKRSQSFMSGRKRSGEEHVAFINEEHTLKSALSILENSIRRRSSNAIELFEKACARMCAQTERPQGAARQQKKFTKAIRDDNWYHCRRILQLLFAKADLKYNTLVDAEKHFIAWLAMMETGTNEPLHWMTSFDGLLNHVWGQVNNIVAKEDVAGCGRIMEELVLFAHGAAICTIAIREQCMASTVAELSDEPTRLQKWYGRIYKFDPRCASPQCLRLLPSPATLESSAIREAFSIGTIDARIGRPAIRAFISKDRKHAYMCLVELLQRYPPDSTLVGVFYWYSHIYHLGGCKPLCGKWITNFV